jgi:hypothetical protein
MKKWDNKILNSRYTKHIFLVCSFLLFFSFNVRSQITIYPVQDFNFGTFYQGSSGGTVDISNAGIRTATGDVVLINSGFSTTQAAFDIEAPQGSVISIENGPDIVITGTNNGSISLRLGSADTGSPFISSAVPPARNRVHIGGTLTVGNNMVSPPGTYQGTFTITINYE